MSYSSTLSHACFIIMLIYLDRAMMRCPEIFMCSEYAHRLVFSAFPFSSLVLQVASKQHEELHTRSVDFAGLVHLPIEEVNLLEKMFLRMLDWRTLVTKEQFRTAEATLVREAIDSPGGFRVLRTLEAQNISGLDAIVCGTKSWRAPGMERRKIVACSTVLIGMWRRSQALKNYYDGRVSPSRER